MANADNLIPNSERTPEELREQTRKGGIASGKARREKKMFRETLESLLTMPMKDGKSADVDEIQSFASVKGQNISVQEAILIAQVQKAMKGDTRAAEYVRDTIGEKMPEKVKMDIDVPISEKIAEIEAYIEKGKEHDRNHKGICRLHKKRAIQNRTVARL